jgi:hypothetical protein
MGRDVCGVDDAVRGHQSLRISGHEDAALLGWLPGPDRSLGLAAWAPP